MQPADEKPAIEDVTARKSGQGYSPNALAVLSTVVGLTILVGRAASARSGRASFPAPEMEFLLGILVGSLAISVLLGWLIYWSTHRSNKHGSTAFAIAFILQVTAVPPAIVGIQNRMAARSYLSVVEELRSDTISQLKTGNSGEVGMSQLSTMINALDQAAAESVGDNIVILESLADLYRGMLELHGQLSGVVAELEQAGGLDPGTIHSQAELEKRVSLARSALELSQAGGQAAQEASERLLSHLMARGFPRGKAQTAASGLFPEEMRETSRQVRTAQNRMYSAIVSALTLLQQSWGRWRVDDESSMVVFEDQDTLQQFQRLLNEIDRQRALKNELARSALSP